MKYIKLLVVLFFITALIACSSMEGPYEAVLDDLIKTLPTEVKSELDIPSTYKHNNKNYYVTYVSNNTDVIESDGKVNQGFFDISVSIDLRVEFDGRFSEREVFFVVPKLTQTEVKTLLLEKLNINTAVKKEIKLPKTIEHLTHVATLKWTSSNQDIMTNDGKINYKTTQQNVSLSLEFTCEDTKYEYPNLYNVVIAPLSDEEFVDYTVSGLDIPTIVKEDVKLPAYKNGISIFWESSNPDIFSNEGKYNSPDEDQEIEMIGKFFYKGVLYEKKFSITVLALTVEDKFELAYKDISFPKVVSENLYLKSEFPFNIKGTWKSKNPNIITNSGVITLSNEINEFTLTLELRLGENIMEKDFTLVANQIKDINNHHHLDYAKDINEKTLVNLEIVNDRIVLKDDELEGSFESPIYESKLNFKSLVGSWAAVTNENTTAELLVRVRVDGKWSKYLSYGAFGLGLQNKMFNQQGGVANLKDDEVIITDSKTADAFQYQVVLKRNSKTVESSALSLVSIALDIPNYEFNVDISKLPKKVAYDLPNLYQIDVPVIGNSICSPTSAAMLLMYHGHKFSDELPHREAAKLFREYNSGIYGNWVYNTVGMSAYGENTYVKRIYSLEELIHHLATVGPVALSIRGQTGRYYTPGHLLVVSGYEITDSGRKILVHDPNLPEVEWSYSEDIFNGFTRNVIYVMEPKA